MADTHAGTIHHISEHGVVATHPARNTQPFLVAPTSEGTKFNTLGLDLFPVACLNLHDILFDFDSSFPNHDVAKILAALPGLRKQHTSALGAPPLSIFGHADPLGGDEYNKRLSGRRARAIYSLLLHDSDVWMTLYHTEWSSKGALHAMRDATGQPSGAPPAAIVKAYMSLLYPDPPLTKADFLGRGTGQGGKADFQGCSDFNPLVLLSKHEYQTLPHAKRNLLNQPNRRVLVFLFCPGLKIHPELWPCPSADRPGTECHRRFFANADQRFRPGHERREFAQTFDTFGCRFYDRMAHLSPCEKPATAITIRIRLFDDQSKPIPFARYRVTLGSQATPVRTADKDAFTDVKTQSVPESCLVQWGFPGVADMPFQTRVLLDYSQGDDETQAKRSLHNLGYKIDFNSPMSEQSNVLRSFQREYMPPRGDGPNDGQLDAATLAKIREVHNACNPKPRPIQSSQTGGVSEGGPQ